jgi:hypothetical protein
MLKCNGCGGDVDQLADAADPRCSGCRPRASTAAIAGASAVLESETMARIGEFMYAEAAQLLATVPDSQVADDLTQWAAKLNGAAALRGGAL